MGSTCYKPANSTDVGQKIVDPKQRQGYYG